jgi:hypothetical protein
MNKVYRSLVSEDGSSLCTYVMDDGKHCLRSATHIHHASEAFVCNDHADVYKNLYGNKTVARLKNNMNNRSKFRVWDHILSEWIKSDQLVLRPNGSVTDGSILIDSKYIQSWKPTPNCKNRK